MKTHLVLLAIFTLGMLATTGAQEVERTLSFVKERTIANEREQKFEPRADKSGESLTLPFVDDFSRFSQPTNDPAIPTEWQRWKDNSVYINNRFAFLQPSVGVATFDGTNTIGFPYNFSVPTSYGEADTLTSCPIDISGFSPEDDLYIVFEVQSGGLGNAPELSDSLYMEFLVPGSNDSWLTQWSITSEVETGFTRYFVPVNDPNFFTDSFQFRFRNYATLSGALDIWNLDYLIFDEAINPENFSVTDVAYTEPVSTLLTSYTSMPWTHYIDNPQDHMLVQQSATLANLSDQAINVTVFYQVEANDAVVYQSPDAVNSNFEANSFAEITAEVGSDNFTYPDIAEEGCASFDVNYVVEVGNNTIESNDTLSFIQEFSNYYAYDDGSAETAYALENSAGGQIAMRYEIDQPDTLLGLYVNFVPYRDDTEGENFILKAWEDNNGQPGNELADNFVFQEVTIFEGSRDAFSYYEYDNPIAVSGTIHVGWVQPEAVFINIGNDRNTNANSTRLRFKTGSINGSAWEQSVVPGTVMIRPVFAAGKGSDFVSVTEQDFPQASIYPNPAQDRIFIEGMAIHTASYAILNMQGQAVATGSWNTGEALYVADLPTGIYILRLAAADGREMRQRFIKQ